MRLSESLLFPFACMYGAATAFRNKMFDLGMKKSQAFDVPTLVVGNLAVGGTGKTPFIEFLLHQLANDYRLAVLSRGYGRKTRGFLVADDSTGPSEIGDEPSQVYQKYKERVRVAVGEERVLAIPMILATCGPVEAILLDDAYQHRYLAPDLRILLTTYGRPFFSDKLLPQGRLRESRKNANRADIVVVTKCPMPLSLQEEERYRREIRRYAREGVPIYFSGLSYGEPYGIGPQSEAIPRHLILVTGIVDPGPIVEELSKNHTVLEVMAFADHHRYTMNDLRAIQQTCTTYRKYGPAVLTTEKDAVKLKDKAFQSVLAEIPVFVLPVGVTMDSRDRQQLLQQVEQMITDKQFDSEA
ncbi:lipid-A-disaccharide kinase [Cyclobacterium xiamenense]|uniref:Tetraacyldisaccharide 4'-kinase n=1 Tax=Cyclobacterium xiamenense TaxID=1297121 RepID=A0A1H7BF79_9BACT|nr:tetraacyldisaccharide 4'-kinase [Cyclobacterium xiamenense]SEJ72085.1 lipid-A-disaccharide kinase [Cyclobacterium xiamenense]